MSLLVLVPILGVGDAQIIVIRGGGAGDGALNIFIGSGDDHRLLL